MTEIYHFIYTPKTDFAAVAAERAYRKMHKKLINFSPHRLNWRREKMA
jgi:hypothetical protein